MPLSGTFDVLDFAEVLRLLARRQVTGRLHVRARHYGANLFFEDGSLVGADQSEHQAAAAAGDVRGRLEEVCFELLDADRGTFEFQPGRQSLLHTSVRLKVDPVIARARKRLQEWQELQEAVPSMDLQPRLAGDLNASEVTIDQERWRVLTAIDGRRNLRAIGRTLGLSDFDVCRVVKGLVDDGVVEHDHRATALASATREPATSADAPRSPVEASSPGEAPGPAADPPAHGAADPLGGGGGGGEEPTAGRGDGAGDTVATADADGPPAVAADDAGTKRRVVRIRSRRVADGPPG